MLDIFIAVIISFFLKLLFFKGVDLLDIITKSTSSKGSPVVRIIRALIGIGIGFLCSAIFWKIMIHISGEADIADFSRLPEYCDHASKIDVIYEISGLALLWFFPGIMGMITGLCDKTWESALMLLVVPVLATVVAFVALMIIAFVIELFRSFIGLLFVIAIIAGLFGGGGGLIIVIFSR